jgi:hypothetical protein
MSNVTAPPIPTTDSPDIPASAIAASSHSELTSFLATMMLRQRGHRQADPADVSIAKLHLWTKELLQFRAHKALTRDDKKRIHAIRQNISRTLKQRPWLLKALAQQEAR